MQQMTTKRAVAKAVGYLAVGPSFWNLKVPGLMPILWPYRPYRCSDDIDISPVPWAYCNYNNNASSILRAVNSKLLGL